MPAGAEEAREHVPAPRGDGFAVDDHVELAGLPDVHRGVDIEAFLDEGNETRRPGLITSIRAVEDLDLHVVSMGVAVSAVEFLVKCRVFYLTSGADALCGRPMGGAEARTGDRHEDVEDEGRVINQEPWRVSTNFGLDSLRSILPESKDPRPLAFFASSPALDIAQKWKYRHHKLAKTLRE